MELFCYCEASPARTVGWRDPGFIHTSYMKELWPNTMYDSKIIRSTSHNQSLGLLMNCHHLLLSRYSYRLGHKLPNGSYVWSKKYKFKSPPVPGESSLQRVVIFGDMGKV